jgi:hypothetical protein
MFAAGATPSIEVWVVGMASERKDDAQCCV